MADLVACRKFLSIDKNDLDECLMEQPELYHEVCETAVYAEAERDALQLDYEELFAKLDQDVRTKAAKDEKRLTDKAVEQEIRTYPKVQALQRELLKKKRVAKEWKALERAFDQRMDALKTLVSLHLRQAYGYSLEAGAGQARGMIAEGNRALVAASRRTR